MLTFFIDKHMLKTQVASYAVNTDGTYTFSMKVRSTATYPVEAYLLGGTSYVDFDAASATVNVDGTSMFATSATKVVTVNASGVSTITGYANFPNKTYTIGTTAGLAKIVYVANSQGILSNVLLIGAASSTSATPDAYGYCLGAGNNTVDGQYYNFLVGGAVKSYLSTAGAPTQGFAYGLFFDSTGAIATKQLTYTAGGTVSVYDGFIVVNGDVIYTPSLVAVNVIDVANGNAFADVLESGDSVQVIYALDSTGTVKTAVASFIVPSATMAYVSALTYTNVTAAISQAARTITLTGSAKSTCDINAASGVVDPTTAITSSGVSVLVYSTYVSAGSGSNVLNADGALVAGDKIVVTNGVFTTVYTVVIG